MIISTIPASNCTPQTIVIGRRGTYDTMQIAFDLSYLIENYGSGTAVLAIKRSQDESAYPAVVTQEDATLLWTVNETDTAYVGSGECQLMWYVDGGLAKTIIYPVVVMRDILTTAEEPPEGYQTWVDTLVAEGVKTLKNAQDAAQSASDAEVAKVDAITAKEAAEEAAETAQEAVVHAPIIQNGYWYIWNDGQYVDTGVRAEGQKGDKGDTGEKGDTGNGIASITKTGTSGLVDTYTVTYTDGTSTTFTVTNGAKGDKGDTGATGNGIQSITKTGTSGNVDTYTITYTNGQTVTFTVTNGAVSSVAGKTGAVVLDSGDIAYDATETYESGTVGGGLNDLSRQISDLQDNTIVGLFGAKWDRLTNLLTRTREATGITTDTMNFCHKGSKNANYDNPFDSIYPWSEMVVCDVDLTKYRSGNYTLKECITAVYGDPDFTYEGSNTNFVGRYRPEFWYKSEEDADGNVEFLVSQIERSGFTHSPEAIDGISFCIDDGNGGVTAGANIPLTNISVANIHTRAKNSGFTLQDIHTIDQQIILYLVEYANMNSQAAIGDGCANCYRENDADVISNVSVGNGETTFDITDSALAQYMQPGCQLDIGATRGSVTYRGLIKSHTVSGTTYTITLDRELAVTDGMIASVHGFTACEYDMISDSVGNGSGYIGTNGKANAYYRGALLYANRYSYTLGIYRQQNTNHLWVCPDGIDPDDYDALNTAVHEDTGVALPDLAAAEWQTVGGNAQRIPGVAAFMATGTSSGNSSSPVGDQQYVPLIKAGSTIFLFGCAASNGWSCGAFGGLWNSGSGPSYWYFAGLPILKKSL